MNHTPHRAVVRLRRFVIFISLFFLLLSAVFVWRDVIASGHPLRDHVTTRATHLLARTTPGRALLATFFATQTVTSGGDSTVGAAGCSDGCSLREAITAASANDLIQFSGVTTVSLTAGELAINKNLTIDGSSGVTVTRSSGTFRIFNVTAGTVMMNDLTISNGLLTVTGIAGSGAGIFNTGTLTLTRCTITNNTASSQGGGIENNGTLAMTDCTVSNNTGVQGGGLQNDLTLTMTRCTVNNNTATGSSSSYGGGLIQYGSSSSVSSTLVNCTFYGNTSTNDAGAIGADGPGSMSLTNCTITGNNSDQFDAGGLSKYLSSTVTLTNTIIVGNTKGGVTPSDTTTNVGTFFASSSSNNLIGTAVNGGPTNGTNNNQVGVSTANALLGAVGNYGGTMQTIPLLPGSPAINAGTASGAPTTDQRSLSRVGTTDIGAFESQGFTIAINSGDGQSTGTNSAFANPLSVTVTSGNSEPVNSGKVTFTPPGSGASATIAGNPATISSGVATTGTVTANGTVGNSYSVSATATGANTVNFSLSNTAPATVTSINRTTGTAACANTSASWTVVFNQAVTGVADTNFSLVGGTGASITNVSGAGTTWTVTANTGTAAATLGLNMVNSTGVTPTITNLSFTGQTYTINALPSITLGASPSVGQGATSANLPYTAISGSPNQYSIDYDTTANNAGFADVTNASLLSSPIVLTVPMAAPAAIYNATLTVRNSTTGCSSNSVAFTVRVSTCPASFTVNNSGDTSDADPGNGVCATSGGVCTLRAAIEEANAITACSPLTITITATGTITLGSALPAIAHPNLTINGPGAGNLTVSGNDENRVLSIASGSYNVNISGLTLSDGYIKGADTTAASGTNIADDGTGAGLYSLSSGTVNVTDCVITNNTAQGGNATGGTTVVGGGGRGAGIYLGDGTNTLTRCIISNNSALGGLGKSGTSNFDGTGYGAGVYKNFGSLTVTDCTIADNITDRIDGSVLSGFTAAQGAGIYNASGAMSVTGSTFSGNRRPLTLTLQGAAITNQANSTTITLTNNTFSGNIGSNTISQISSTTTLTMVNCTVANNTLAAGNAAAGAIFVAGGSTLNLKNTVLGNNADGPNIRKFGTVTSQGNNFDSDGTTLFTNNVNGDIVGTSGSKKDPKLSALGNYGGLTKTQVPLPDSQLLDAGTSSGAPATDQRGIARAQGSAYDIGAVEAQAFTLAIVGGNNQNTTVGTQFPTALQVNLKEGSNNIQGAPISYVAPGGGGVASTNPTSGTATTDASGNASYTATANTVAGSYNVSAFISTLVKQFALTNNPGAAVNFLVSAPSSVTAGTSFNFTVTARDSNGNTATGYTGTVHFTSTDGNAMLPANSTLTNGVGTFPATLRTAGTQTITATDTVSSAITGTSNNITVNPGAAASLMVSAPSTATAGTSFNFTVTAKDAFNNTATGYTGTLGFTSSDANATLPANSLLTNGVGTFSATLKTAGTRTITATDTVSSSLTGVSNNITVNPSAATHFVVSAPSSATAGTAFNFTVTAKDACDNTATGYTGTVKFTSTDSAAILPSNATLTNGTGTFSATLKTAGTRTITATDTVSSSITGTSGNITVNPGAATMLVVTAPANATLGSAFSFTVTAKDACNNTATGYTGTVTFTSTDGAAGLPANYSFVAGDNGVRTFTNGATLNTINNQTITATDTVTAAITGTSGNIFVSLNGCPSTFTVNDTGDTTDANLGNGVCADSNGKCTLRAAIQEANALTSCSPLTINITATGTITLGSNLPTIAHSNLTITGPGADQLTVDGVDTYRPFEIGLGSYAVTLSGLRVYRGRGNGGGGLLNQSTGTVNVNNMAFTGNAITGSSGGGGIRHASSGTLNVTDSTFTNNIGTPTGGGGISNFAAGTLNVTNSTFSGNVANLGSGIHTHAAGFTNITNCTLSGNGGNGVNTNANGTTTIKNTIAVGHISADISGSFTGSNNLTGTVANALLGTLGNYGGTTDTFPLLPGSPALNAGTASGAPSTDQRGVARPQGTGIDIGAFESRGFTLAVNSGNNQSATAGSSFMNPLSVTVTASNSEPVNGGQVTFTPPGSGATASIAGTPATISSGTATTGTVTPNLIVGPYNVAASTNGASSINFALTNTNSAPSFMPASAISRQQGSPAGAAVAVGTVSDAQTAAGSLVVTQIAGGTATGITVTNILNTGGTITAQLAASCTATAGTVRFQVSDGGLTNTGDLQVNITPNTKPTLAYGNTMATAGAGANNSPTTATDNGSLDSYGVFSQGTYTGTVSVNASGVVTFSNAAPTGMHTITIRATDNCGATQDASFTLTVNCPTITVTPPAMSYASLGAPFNQAFTQTGAVGTPTFTLESGTLPTGLMLDSNGVLFGSTTQVGSFPIKVKVTDSNSCTGISATYTLQTGNNIPFSAKISDPLVCIGDNYLTVHAEVANPNNVNANMNFNAVLPAQLTGVAGTCVVNFGTCTVNNGSVSVTGVLPANQTVTIDYKVRVANGTAQGTLLCVDSTASLNNGAPVMVQACTNLNCPTGGPPANVQAGGQKSGSLLVFPYYVSKTAPRKDTRLTISNIGTQTSYAHIFFIDGTSCAAADQFVCLTPNASASFKASEYDPETTGWLLAVAVNSDGLPVVNNALIGNAFVVDGDYVDNYNAEAFRAYSPALAAIENVTATLFLDGSSYDAAPSQFAVEVQSPLDAAGQRLVIASLQGDLTTGQLSGASQVGTGLVYNGNEKPFGSFSTFVSGKCQAFATITSTTPRVPNGMNVMIPSGQVGTLKFNVGAGVGLLMTPRTAPWRGIRALHKTALTNATLTIPIFRPVC